MNIVVKVIDGSFSVCKVSDYSLVNPEKPFCFIGTTPDEKSLVCRSSDVPENTIERDDGWSLFMIEGVLDFSLIGILSSISSILASASVGIFAISTFTTDYILVKNENREKAIKALVSGGFEVTE